MDQADSEQCKSSKLPQLSYFSVVKDLTTPRFLCQHSGGRTRCEGQEETFAEVAINRTGWAYCHWNIHRYCVPSHQTTSRPGIRLSNDCGH